MRNFQISDLNLTLTVTLTHPNLNHSQIEQRILQITQTYNLRAAEALSLIHTLIRAMRHISGSRWMMMMKLLVLLCAEKLELVLSTAPKTWDNTDKDSKNIKRSH